MKNYLVGESICPVDNFEEDTAVSVQDVNNIPPEKEKENQNEIEIEPVEAAIVLDLGKQDEPPLLPNQENGKILFCFFFFAINRKKI